jgi:cytochrome c oxidase subunit 2
MENCGMQRGVGRMLSIIAVTCMIFGMQITSAQEQGNKIEIHAKRFAFEPAEITVKKGEAVTLILTSDDVPHSLVIDELGVKGSMSKGQKTSVTFTPMKSGTFQGKCGRFCGSGHGSMKMVVHVTDN